jgi:ribosomal protein L11 methyltransferase
MVYLRLLLPLPEAPSDDALAEWEDRLIQTLGDAFGGAAWLSGSGFATWVEAGALETAEAVRRVAGILGVEPARMAVDDAGGPEDWRKKWRDAFQPIDAGGFRIVPPWLVDADAEQHPDATRRIIIDPGAGFGTGQHETTRLILRAMGNLWRERAGDFAQRLPRVLDAGSGSGILALASLKLGAARPVAATEMEADSAGNARWNFSLNGFAFDADADYRVTTAIDWEPGSFDVVLCNMLSEQFSPLLADLFRVLAPGGALLLGGFLDKEEADVRERVERAGFEPAADCLAENDWRHLTATRP